MLRTGPATPDHPTLPLAASLGLTFTWNVTLGIPIYIALAEWLIRHFPVHAGS